MSPGRNLPTKSSPEYNELVRTFYIGLAALEVGHDVQADAKLAQFTQLAPTEPAGWANWGLLALRQRNYDVAAERLHKARDLAPDNSDIHYLLGLLESSRGNTPEAIEELRKAAAAIAERWPPQHSAAAGMFADQLESLAQVFTRASKAASVNGWDACTTSASGSPTPTRS